MQLFAKHFKTDEYRDNTGMVTYMHTNVHASLTQILNNEYIKNMLYKY